MFRRPLNLYGWKPCFLLNIFLFCFFLGTSTGCGIYYSIKQLINNIHTFHWFASCFILLTTALTWLGRQGLPISIAALQPLHVFDEH